MRRVIPLEKKVESKNGIVLLDKICNYINEHLDEFDDDDYKDLTELCLYLLTGSKRDEINTSFFETINVYLRENIGRVEIDFSNEF